MLIRYSISRHSVLISGQIRHSTTEDVLSKLAVLDFESLEFRENNNMYR